MKDNSNRRARTEPDPHNGEAIAAVFWVTPDTGQTFSKIFRESDGHKNPMEAANDHKNEIENDTPDNTLWGFSASLAAHRIACRETLRGINA